MGLLDLIKKLFGLEVLPPGRFGIEELARRLDTPADGLACFEPTYRAFSIPKRGGGTRTIRAPDPATKALQRRVLRRLLGRLKHHPAVMGFEKGRSVVHNALAHAGRPVVVRMDVRDFFPATRADRVRRFFRLIGWDDAAADVLLRLCADDGGLPQGAPTSPRLSNLVNLPLDQRLMALGAKAGAMYTRYADDMTFSFARDDHAQVARVIRGTKLILDDYGYALHQGRKLRIRRRHQRQTVTGLVVNERPALPRPVRRWLRAVQHHVQTGRPATLSAAQLAGWQALERMIAQQSGRAAGADA